MLDHIRAGYGIHPASVTTPADLGQKRGKIVEPLGHYMDHFTLALHLAAHAHHAGAQQDLPMLFKKGGPDNEIGHARLVLQSDKHDALGRAGLLVDQNDTGQIDPAPVLKMDEIAAGHNLVRLKVGAQEGYRTCNSA